ncbi:MAG: hypothetical protein HZC26_04340 [Candidatus Magasanikbacteria bacterium]|nr:hypothetical protein [Candidatus Magasanikbacteria bacterium]
MPPRAKKVAKSAVVPDTMPLAVTPTVAVTATEVKTKVVSKTAMAIAVAFLGFAAIAAGLVALPQSDPMYGYNNNTCWDSDYTVKNNAGMPLFRYSFVNFGTKGTAYGIKTNSNEYVAGTDECLPTGRLMEFFCDIKTNRVTWNGYACLSGTSCVDGACVSAGKPDITILDISMSPNANDPTKKDVSVTLKNVGNAVSPPVVVNIYQKNNDDSNQVLVWAELSAMDPGITTVYANYGLSLPAAITLAAVADPSNLIIESNETNNYFEKSFTEIGKMNFQVKQTLSKLTNGSQDLGVMDLSALNEPVTFNGIKFTIWNVSPTTTLSNLRLVDETFYGGTGENIIAGPIELVADPNESGTYYAIFNNIVNFVLPSYDPKLIDWQKQLTLKGSVSGASTGAYVGVRINPAKDVVGTGMNSGQKISPAFDKLLVVSDKSY